MISLVRTRSLSALTEHFVPGCAVRLKIKEKVVEADLQKVQFPPAFAGDMVKVYTAK